MGLEVFPQVIVAVSQLGMPRKHELLIYRSNQLLSLVFSICLSILLENYMYLTNGARSGNPLS